MIAGYVNGVNKDLLVGGQAANVGYDNTVSGLTATDTQGAIDEVAADLMQGNDFACTPQSGATIQNWTGKKIGALTKVSGSVTLATAMTPSTADITFGKISENIPTTNVITMVVSGKAIGAVFVKTNGDLVLRYMNGSVNIGDFTFNVVY